MKTFIEAFDEKYPESKIIMKHFRDATKCYPEWDNLTKTNLLAFVKYLRRIVSQSTARTYAAMVKSVLNDYKEEAEIPCKRFDEALRIKQARSINTFLDEGEIMKIVQYETDKPSEKYVKNIFLLGCLTGTRHSDCITFNKGNIVRDNFVYI